MYGATGYPSRGDYRSHFNYQQPSAMPTDDRKSNDWGHNVGWDRAYVGNTNQFKQESTGSCTVSCKMTY